MSPKPCTPDDEIEYVNGAGIRKKKGKSGNSQKRCDYFLQQRFPFLKALVEEDQGETKKRGMQRKASAEEQQAAAAPLARARVGMMQEYKRRLLARQQELEQAVTGKLRTVEGQE